MSIWSIILAILFLLVCAALNVIILLQKDRASGFSANFSGGGNDTYYSKNKGRSKEGTLERYTKIGGVVFGALALVLLVVF